MRRTIGFVLMITAVAAFGQTPDVVKLSGTWKFALGSDQAGIERLSRFYQSSFEFDGFRPIPVPSNWALQGFEEPMYDRLKQSGEGFYLHSFTAPERFKDRRVLR